jgi:hypothetical protein
VILLVLVALLWIVVLVPSAYRRYRERGGAGSIDHFHHQLDLLGNAGPKLVTPAYRLHNGDPGEGIDAPSAPADDEQSADIDDFDGAHYERVGVLDPPEPPLSRDRARGDLQDYRRQQARRRCSSILLVLTGLTLSTALLGALPALRPAWIMTALTGVLLLGIVALMAYARQIDAQNRRSSLPVRADEGEAVDTYDTHESYAAYESFDSYEGYDFRRGAAESGFPGAWDDEDDFPQQAMAGS